MLHVVLWQPQIPPNTGNIARSCAAVGVRLHIVGKIGFRTDDADLKRAGLDFWPHVDLHYHAGWEEFLAAHPNARLWLVDNPAPRIYTKANFQDGDMLVFGSEKTGIPWDIREAHKDGLLSIPMPTGKVRSLNLSTSVGIVLFEALRQVEGW